jgi:bifunctional non-homologous end joining protein LigD
MHTRSEISLGSGRRLVRLTHLDQDWWPEHGLRKRHVVEYYRTIAGVLLPHLADRPLTMKRYFNGPRSPFAWVKDAPPELPAWIAVSAQPAKSRRGAAVQYAVIQNESALLWMIEYGCIDFHVWSSRRDLPGRPDYVLFDLDRHQAPFGDVISVAQLLRRLLEALGLQSLPKTTGGTGLHVQVPIARRHTHEEAREFCRFVAAATARASTGLVTTEPRIADRRGVYIDAKMNGHGQQVVSVYSLRPNNPPAIATPLAWEEIDDRLDPRELTISPVLERVHRNGDLHRQVLAGKQLLRPALERLNQS